MQSLRSAEQVASAVRAEMARRDVSQVALGELLGLSQAAVSRRLRARTEFKVSELLRVADVLGVQPAELLRTHP